MRSLMLSIFILLLSNITHAGEMTLRFSVNVPSTYSSNTAGTPTGQSEHERYKEGYVSFWLNCVSVRTTNLMARCPTICNGTAGASDGCMAGAMDADKQIDNLVRLYPASKVMPYLKEYIAQPAVSNMFKKGRFHGKAAEAKP